MPSVNPYLSFNGNCAEAFNFYKSVFGGEFNSLVKFKDMPMEQKLTSQQEEQIMHVSLPIGKNSFLMASDSPEGFGPKLVTGNNFSLSVDTESEAEATKIFNGLAAGGKITMPLDKSPWNSFFGMLTDKFGINWMVSYNYEKK